MITSRRFVIAAALSALTITGLVTPVQAEGNKPEAETLQVGLFEAMDAGHVDVKFIPHDASKANLLVKNLTDKPLEIRLPSAFAGVPVLGQMGMGMGGMGGGMGGMGGMGGGGMGGGGGQAMGGGMGGGGMGGGMGGMGGGMGGKGGMMRVAPERMRKMQVTTVCLEHGKPDPNPRCLTRSFHWIKSPKIPRLPCFAKHSKTLSPRTQAAAWHLMDKMSWGELAAKNRVESKYLGTIRWFSAIELRTAAAVVSECQRISKARKPSDETSESGYEG